VSNGQIIAGFFGKGEKTMTRIKGLIAIAAFSLLVLGLPAIASAQYGNGYPNAGYPNGGYPNGGYPNGGNGNGGYGNNGYYGDIRSTVRDLKDRAKNFEHIVDRGNYNNGGYNNGGWGNGGYYDKNAFKDFKKLLDRFTSATDRLEDKYGRGRDLNNSADSARNAIDLGSQIEQSMYRLGSNNNWQYEWNQIRNDLQIVANTYGYNYNNRGYNQNNRNNRYPQNRTGSRTNLPSWWPF
jgi:hypothetical protein